MEENTYVDAERSISLGKVVLTLEKSWFYYFDLISTILILLFFAFVQVMFGWDSLKYKGVPDKIFATILFIVASISLFGVYRKLVESKLLMVEHDATNTKVKELLLEYFKDVDEKNIIKTSNCFLVRKEFSYFSKLYTFIISDNFLYFNIVNKYPKGNPPVIIDHIILRDDLKKLFSTGEIRNAKT